MHCGVINNLCTTLINFLTVNSIKSDVLLIFRYIDKHENIKLQFSEFIWILKMFKLSRIR